MTRGGWPMSAGRRALLARAVALSHGAALIATGAWPLVDLRSFERVTGPKHDDWLVRTVGGLAVAFGAGLVWRSDDPRAARPFGIAAATTFAAADIIGVASGRLRRVYLLDTLVEGAFLVGWLLTLNRRRAGGGAGASGTPRRVAVPLVGPARSRDLATIRRDVAERQADAARAAELAWPRGGAPDAVTEALHRLDEAREQLAFVAEGDDPDGLRELAANAAEDAAAIHEAADLISS
ncbi:MAG: hypothetical protein U0869_15440 [Chloroflexota bacterium]